MFRIEALPLPDNSATGWCCGEVSLWAAIKHLDPATTITVDDILRTTRKRPDFNTWPSQLVRARQLTPHLDYRIVRALPEPVDLESHIRACYGPNAQREIDGTAFKDVAEDINNAQPLYVLGSFGLDDIRQRLTSGTMVLPIVSWHALHGIESQIGDDMLHYVLVSGFDEHSIYIHDSGDDTEQFRAAAYRPIPNDKFIAALAPENVYVAISKKA